MVVPELLRQRPMHRSLVICLLAACAGPSGPPQGDGLDELAGPVDGQENQGRDLLGASLDDLGEGLAYYPSVSTAATTAAGRAVKVRVAGSAALAFGRHVGVDPELAGLLLVDSQGDELRVTPVRGGTDLAFYKLERRGTDPENWTNVCEGGDAVPFYGRWTRTGLHEADAEHISFACTGAVAWKCSVWGYLAGTDDKAQGWSLHQACTRMARGDYCANGESHTREGTEITIYDRVGIGLPIPETFPGVKRWPPPKEGYFFEAAWNGGARGASCLGRVRWQSLAIGGVCGKDVELGDPRNETSARFCDDIDFATAADPPLLFNTSHYSDLGLDEWVSGDDHVSTVRGYFDGSDTTPDRFPFGDHSYTHVGRDALLLRDPRDTADLVEVFLYSNGRDRTLATRETPLPPGYVEVEVESEGWASRVQRPRMIEFRLYRNPETGDAIATTKPRTAPYVDKGLIGYLLPAE